MSMLITAPIRTGKTLLAIKLCFDFLNKGRQVYTNIVGIKIDGVISVSSSIDDPFDWRQLPNGCALIWDEAHEHPAFSDQDLLKNFKINEKPYDDLLDKLNEAPNLTTAQIRSNIDKIEKAKKLALEKRKEEIRDIGRSLLLHGHFGIEIVFITQRVTKLNTDVLASVTSHFVMRRKFGMDAAIIWEFGEAMTTWSKSTAEIALNKKLWRYPKHLYKFYVSSENHQVRKSFPFKYYVYACIPLLFFAYGLLNVKDTGFFGLFKDDKIATSSIPTPNPATVSPVAPVPASDSNIQIVCTYQNINTEECQNLVRIQNMKLNEDIQKVTYYNVNDPYASLSPNMIKMEANDFPRLSGCIKYAGKYYGIDQQGNRMPNVQQEACRRWIEDSQRPFDYFATNQRSNYSQEKNRDTESSKLKIVTDQQDQKNYQYMQNTIN